MFLTLMVGTHGKFEILKLFLQRQRTNSVTSDSAFSECTTSSTDMLDRLPSVETVPARFPFQPSSTEKPGQLTLTPIQTQSSD